jgi:hypothetical protein
MTVPIGKVEFNELLEMILEELGAQALLLGEDVVKESLLVRAEVDEALKLFRDPLFPKTRVLGVAMGLVDEMVRAKWGPIVDDLYEAYLARHREPRPTEST